MPSSILNSDDGVISGTSGLKSSGGDDGVLVFQSKGTETARINTDKQIEAAAGTVSLPSITTTGDVNTGIFFLQTMCLFKLKTQQIMKMLG
jgi:hypothetical protein